MASAIQRDTCTVGIFFVLERIVHFLFLRNEIIQTCVPFVGVSSLTAPMKTITIDIFDSRTRWKQCLYVGMVVQKWRAFEKQRRY